MDGLSVLRRPFSLPYSDILVAPPKSLASTSSRPTSTLHRRVESASGARNVLSPSPLLDPASQSDRDAVLDLSTWVGKPHPVDITLRNDYRRPRLPRIQRLRTHSAAAVEVPVEPPAPHDYTEWSKQVSLEEARLKSEIATVEKQLLGQQNTVDAAQAQLAVLTSAFNTSLDSYRAQSLSLNEELERIVITKDTVQTDPQAFLRKSWIKEELAELKRNYEAQAELQRTAISQATVHLNTCQSELAVLSAVHTTNKTHLRDFYYRALKEGKACRSDGIRWVIKGIWTMGEDVPVSAFPSFLDRESMQYLLDQAEREVDLAGFRARYRALREALPRRPQVRLNNVPGT